MLRINASGVAAALSYFKEGLAKEDGAYYTKDCVECVGKSYGKAATMLGFEQGQNVSNEAYRALILNRHPQDSHRQLTPSSRDDGKIVSWDFTLDPPKSYSIAAMLGDGDPRLVTALQEASREVMAEIEKIAATRVRINGAQSDRLTSNICYSAFFHHTSRPTSKTAVPDVNLHIHNVVHNLTYDSVEKKFKALKIHDIVKQAPYFQALAHSIVARKAANLGYTTRRTKNAFEIVGADSPELIRKNSSRNAQIEAVAERLGITDKKKKSELGKKTRSGKQKEWTLENLKVEWNKRLTKAERESLSSMRGFEKGQRYSVTVSQTLDWAEGKLFERNSVVRRDHYLTAALRYGVGYVTHGEILAEMAKRGYIERNVDGVDLVTTPVQVREECAMLRRARSGRNSLPPIFQGKIQFSDARLTDEQRRAVKQIVTSKDQIMLLRGRAGVGKTTVLTEIRLIAESQGKRVIALAPSSSASRGVLRSDGFQGADTLARFLVDQRFQQSAKGQLILLDEASLVGIIDFAKLQEIAGSSTRILVCGDVGQHSAVPRGSVMKLLEDVSDLKVATVSKVQRQQKESYRDAVEALAAGDLVTGFQRLEKMKAIREIPDEVERYRELAADWKHYLDETGKAPLAVSPTHAEGKLVTNAIRSRLAEDGVLGSSEYLFERYVDTRWEEVEKKLPENFVPGMKVGFVQNVAGAKKGSVFDVVESNPETGVLVQKPNGDRMKLDLSIAERFKVYEVEEIAFARGDKIKFTAGGKSANGRRLDNGDTGTIQKIGKDGRITLTNGVVLDPDHGHWNYGYCHTSHSSQGKTVDAVLIAQSSLSRGAASVEQFYVSATRGRNNIHIYTDDYEQLQLDAARSSQRLSAVEFTGIGKELAMNEGGLSGVEWAKRVRTEIGQKQKAFETHVEKLMKQRKIHAPAEKIHSFTAYIEGRRANITGGGRARAKIAPPPKNAKRSKGMTDPRRVEMRNSTKAKVAIPKAELEAKQKERAETQGKKKKSTKAKSQRVKRAANAHKTSSKHLKRVVDRGVRVSKQGKPKEKEIKFGNVRITPKKLLGAKSQEAQVARKVARKAEPPKAKPPTPVVRRGR